MTQIYRRSEAPKILGPTLHYIYICSHVGVELKIANSPFIHLKSNILILKPFDKKKKL